MTKRRVPLRVLYSQDPLKIIVYKAPPDHVIVPLSKGLRIEPERTLSASTRIRKNLYRALFRTNSDPPCRLYRRQLARTYGLSKKSSLVKDDIYGRKIPFPRIGPPPPHSDIISYPTLNTAPRVDPQKSEKFSLRSNVQDVFPDSDYLMNDPNPLMVPFNRDPQYFEE